MAFLEVYRQQGVLYRWRWRRRSANGRIIADPGQGFTRKWSAKRSAKQNFPKDGEPRTV